MLNSRDPGPKWVPGVGLGLRNLPCYHCLTQGLAAVGKKGL